MATKKAALTKLEYVGSYQSPPQLPPSCPVLDPVRNALEEMKEYERRIEEHKAKLEALKDDAYHDIVKRVAEYNSLFGSVGVGSTLLLNFETSRQRKPRACAKCRKPGHVSRNCPGLV